MYAKIEITGIIEVVTGMHIGGSSAFAAIGAVDSPIMKDARTNLPMIPGSSLKGKMRTLLAKYYNEKPVKCEQDVACIKRLFGSSKEKEFKNARLIFSDMVMSNEEHLRESGIQVLTEVKFENSINRLTGVANPRQIERAIRGTEFPLSIIYEVEDKENVEEDFQVLREGMTLLEYDYLGGHGTRGYGKIKFKDMDACCVVGDVDEELLDNCIHILENGML